MNGVDHFVLYFVFVIFKRRTKCSRRIDTGQIFRPLYLLYEVWHHHCKRSNELPVILFTPSRKRFGARNIDDDLIHRQSTLVQILKPVVNLRGQLTPTRSNRRGSSSMPCTRDLYGLPTFTFI